MQSTRGLETTTGRGPRRGRAVRTSTWAAALGLVLVMAATFGSAATARAEPAEPPSSSAPADEQDSRYFCYLETLTADRPSIYGYLAPRGCQPSGVFQRGERLVFRFEALDTTTGKRVTPEDATVQVRLPFIGDMEADFKQRGEGLVPDAPWTWDYCWDVPPDYPLGTLDYSIVISRNDGGTGFWKPPALVDPRRGIDTRPQIIE